MFFLMFFLLFFFPGPNRSSLYRVESYRSWSSVANPNPGSQDHTFYDSLGAILTTGSGIRGQNFVQFFDKYLYFFQYCGSGIGFFLIPDPGCRIQDHRPIYMRKRVREGGGEWNQGISVLSVGTGVPLPQLRCS
jgi:hypothetical protein